MKVLDKIFVDMKVRHPNAWHLRPYMEKGWDGKLKYLTEAGYSRTGLLPMIASLLDKYNEKYLVVDTRKSLEQCETPKEIGEFIARPYQIEAVESILYNEVMGVPFQRGVVGAAVNAGKTLIAAMIHKSFKNTKTIILVNNRPLFEQFLKDMPSMFGEEWGYMYGKNLKWGNIMVCMTPTLRNNLDRYATKLATYQVLLFDECHLITSKTNKKVMTALYNTVVRVGLSGTPFAHKDPTKNMDVKAFFGEEVFKITSLELIDMGFSTSIIIKIIKGNTIIKMKGDYDEEYRKGIIESEERTESSLDRIAFYLKRKKYPILVVGRYHQHVERLHSAISDRFGNEYTTNYIHGDVKDRELVLADFKDGKIDILVASLLIKIGQNMPLIQYMQNAAGGDSQITALQLVGRAVRKHKTKKKVYYEDFWDEGAYIRRHSKHRIAFYKKEGYKVIEIWKHSSTINNKLKRDAKERSKRKDK